MGKNYIIVGAGFRGFCDSLELLKIDGNKVHIIEPAPFFGGINYSMKIKGFYVDKGVHIFDSIPFDLADIINEIMEGQTRPVDFVSASAFNGFVTDGYSLPDLSSLEKSIKQKIKREILELASKGASEKKYKNLEALFIGRFGPTVGNIYRQIFKKIYSINPDLVAASGLAVTSLHRLKFLDDQKMLKLKEDPYLDTILAARRKSMGKIDDTVSIYPDTGEAMRGWCERAAEWLKSKGAIISLGEKIISIQDNAKGVSVKTDKGIYEANKVIWANDNISSLTNILGIKTDIKDLQYGTPMVYAILMTHVDKIKNFTYLQNFNINGYTFRTAATGLFSNQVRDDGISFITSECPVEIGSVKWKNAKNLVPDIWEECKALEIVKQDADLVDYKIIRFPSTFKPPLVGYHEKLEDILDEVQKRSQRVYVNNTEPFFRREIYLDSLELNERVG